MNNHIVATDGTDPDYPYGFACLVCGAKEAIPKRLPMSVYLAWGKSFTKAHRECKSILETQEKEGV